MSFTKYPEQIDDATTIPAAIDLVTPVNAEGYNRLRDAILAIETELGSDPSRVFGNVRDRLDDLTALISALTARVTTTEGRLDVHDATLLSLQAQIDAAILSLEAQIAASDASLQTQIDALAAAAEVVTPIISGIENTDSTTFTAVGAAPLNPTNLGHPAVTFTLEVILQTTDASFAASFELFNITEGIVVAHPTITTTAIVPTLITNTITIGGADLPAGQTNILEGRIKLASGAATSDRAICKYGAVRSKLA